MDTILYGILVLAIGLAVVFIGLIMLIILTKGIKLVSLFGKKQTAEVQVEPKIKQVPVYNPVRQTSAPVAVKQADNSEILAVISAALASFDGEQVIIRSVRRMNQSNVWARAGRSEQIAKRF
ncbi:MAG: OadG family protein [Christensenellales bacterium]